MRWNSVVMRVEALPVDEAIKEQLRNEGILELYPPQAEAIETGFLETGENLVVAIPTASGKTLVAKIAIAQRLLEQGGKAVYLSPLRALAKEKYDELRRFLEPLGFRTVLTTGDYDSDDGWLGGYDVIVTTNEKFDSILRRKPGWLEALSILISDEVHFMGSKDRGPVLEIVLTQIQKKFVSAQILALSATIKNADEIAEWLNAKLVYSEWRPVVLKEGVYFDEIISYSNGEEIALENEFGEPYITLAVDAYRLGGQALVFANTRASAETSAEKVGRALKKELSPKELATARELANELEKIGEDTQLKKRLVRCVSMGTAFHHAGLHYKHRELVENAFRENKLKVISATPTLAAGINIPARVVIIRSLTRYEFGYGNTWIPVMEYKQMAGRAGRPQYDSEGEAIVVALNKRTRDFIIDNYINADVEPIESKLAVESVMRTLILSLVVTKDAQSIEEIMDFIERTFLGYTFQSAISYLESQVERTVKFLKQNALLKQSSPLEATKLGRRVSELYLDPLSAITIKEGLKRAQTLVEVPNVSYLHLICSTPDMRTFFTRKKEEEVLDDQYQEMLSYWLVDYPEESKDYVFNLQALKTALVLEEWMDEISENSIILKWGVGSGDIISAVSTGDWLLYATEEIAGLLSYDESRKQVEIIRERLKAGVKEELLDLVRLPGIGRVRARILYNNGYPSPHEIATAPVKEIARLQGFGVRLAEQIIKAAKKRLADDGHTDIKETERNDELVPIEEAIGGRKESIGEPILDDYFSSG